MPFYAPLYSPTKARLQGRINALMAQRYAEAAASGATVLGAPAGGQKVLSTLSGMELVQVALKQVGTHRQAAKLG